MFETYPRIRGRSTIQTWLFAYLHYLRTLRHSAIVWLVAIAGIGAALVATVDNTYGPQELARIGPTLEGVPAFEALFGRTVAMETLEGFVLWRWGGIAFLLAAIWGMRDSARLTRGEEESGHTEPLRAGVVAPRTLLAAALGAILTMQTALAVMTGISHSAAGMDPATAWAFGATLAMVAATSATVSALAAQIVLTRKHVLGIVGGFLGLAFGIRVLAAATATPDWLWWATPFGWATFVHEADNARSTLFTAFGLLFAGTLIASFALAQRELHGGLMGFARSTDGPRRPLRGHADLAFRLGLRSMIPWGTTLAAIGTVFGLMADDFSSAMSDLGTPIEVFEQIGFAAIDTVEGMVALTFGFLVLVLALFAGAQTVAIRDEEASWRIENFLVRPVSRISWLATRTVFAAVALCVVALIAAFAAWVGTGGAGAGLPLTDMLFAGMNLLPTAVLFLGIGIGLFGLAPRAAGPTTYGLVLAAYVLDLAGPLLDLPNSVLAVGPLYHLPPVPAADFAITSSLVMVGVGVAGVLAGLVAFRRRDLVEA